MIYKGVELYNVQELLDDQRGDGVGCTRIPNVLRLQINDSAQLHARFTSGCELRFVLKSHRATIVLSSPERRAIVEVYQGCFRTAWHIVDAAPTEIVITQPANIDELARVTAEEGLPFDARLTRVVLPWHSPSRIIDIQGCFELPRGEQTPSMTLLCYGSSITQGAHTIGATGTYAARLAQHLGVDLINLGFGGGAHLERQIADYVAGRTDWDLATLEMGINLVMHIDVEEFARRVGYFVPTIARAHPDKWVFCIDLFTCRHDYGELGKKAASFRRIVRDVVTDLKMPRLVYVNGRDLLTSLCGLTPDLTHPSARGMEEIARNLSAVIGERIH